ncbi:MAG: hypothetical protein KC910_05600 [Candidatus Eremiobacteraeota bacterium]|nr:hypothetical protein [Candidatus Eremiobacteraeota bacterium]
MRTFLAIVLSLFLVAPVWADTTIVGGKRAGDIRIGQSVSEAQKVLGKPSRVREAESDKKASMQFFDARGMALLIDASKNVLGITVTSTSYATAESIRVGTPEATVRKLYGTGLARGTGNVSYPERGISFSFQNGKVTHIYVVKPEQDRPLLGDRLIVPGKRVGDLQLGGPFTVVEKAWGKPDSRSDLSNHSGEIIAYRQHGVRFVVISGRIDAIMLTTGDFITKQGVKIGSDKDEVIRAFGKDFKTNDAFHSYPGLGIGFMLGQGDVIEIQILYPSKPEPGRG